MDKKTESKFKFHIRILHILHIVTTLLFIVGAYYLYSEVKSINHMTCKTKKVQHNEGMRVLCRVI